MGLRDHFFLWQCWPSRIHIYGSVDPFHLMEVPTTRLPNDIYSFDCPSDLLSCVP